MTRTLLVLWLSASPGRAEEGPSAAPEVVDESIGGAAAPAPPEEESSSCCPLPANPPEPEVERAQSALEFAKHALQASGEIGQSQGLGPSVAYRSAQGDLVLEVAQTVDGVRVEGSSLRIDAESPAPPAALGFVSPGLELEQGLGMTEARELALRTCGDGTIVTMSRVAVPVEDQLVVAWDVLVVNRRACSLRIWSPEAEGVPPKVEQEDP